MKPKLRTVFLTLCHLCLCASAMMAQQPRLVLPIGHTDQVTSAQFSPDGHRFITTSLDNTVKIWDSNTGKLLLDLRGSALGAAAFSKDNSTIITTDKKGTINFWNSRSGILLTQLKGHSSEVLAIKFSPDGRKFISNSSDGTCKIWDFKNRKLLSSLVCYKQNTDYEDAKEDYEETSKELRKAKRIIKWAMKMQPKGADKGNKQLDSVSKQLDSLYQIPVKDAEESQPKSIEFDSLYNKEQQYLKEFEANYAQFSTDGKKVITTAANGTVRIWDAETGRISLDLKETLSNISNAVFSLDNSRFLTVSFNGARVWDAKSGKLLFNIEGQYEQGGFFGNDKRIYTTSDDGEIKIWNASNGKFIVDLIGHDESVRTIAFSKDQKKMLTSSFDKTAKIWDLNTNKVSVDFHGHKNKVVSAQFSPDGSSVLTASYDFTARTWETTTGKVKCDTKGYLSTCLSGFFSSDNSKIIISYNGNAPKIWSRYTGKITGSLGTKESKISYAKFYSKDKKIITNSIDGINLWDSQNLNSFEFFPNGTKYEDDLYKEPKLSPDDKFILHTKLNEIFLLDAKNGDYMKGITEFPTSRFGYAEFSPDGKRIAAVYNRYYFAVSLWKTDQFGKFVKKDMWDRDPNIVELKGHKSTINSVKFSSDGKRIVTASADYTAKIFDAVSEKELKPLVGHTDEVILAEFSPNGDKIVTGSVDGTAKIWNPEKGNILFDLRGHNSTITALNFSKDGKTLLTASLDNTCKLWDIDSGKLIYTFFPTDSLEYFNYLPNGYYLASKDAVKGLHYVTKDLQVITFEQLDVKYNRPDKVLAAMGNPDTTLINSYKRAYDSRIEKLGIDTTAFDDTYNVPEADFANRSAIKSIQTQEKIKLRIKGSDQVRKLNQFNVWINKVPMYGLKGISLERKNSKELDTTIVVEIAPGENRIETSIRNDNGIESYRIPLSVRYDSPVKPKEKVYFIGIGIDKYKDQSKNLKYSSKDITVLAEKMKKKYGTDIVIDTLLNTRVTIENVKALKTKLLKTTVNDKVIVVYSGHGLLSSSNKYYLATYPVSFDEPERDGLPYDELENILDSIPARKKLLLLDACHSGEVGRREDTQENKPIFANTTPVKKQAASKGRTGKKGVTAQSNSSKNRIGLTDSFELMQTLFVNVGKNTGSTVFAAAAGSQAAYETDHLQHSVFSYYIIKAFDQNKSLKLSELKKNITENVFKESDQKQIPTSRSETIAYDWELW